MKVFETVGLFAKFLRESFLEFHYTGALFPTSQWAAQAMTAPLRARCVGTSRKILELGPGSGSVTKKILADMSEHDELTVCEINPRFMEMLKKVLKDEPDFKKHESRIRFFCCPAQDLPEDRQYDVVVCSLPFLNFDRHTVRHIFNKLVSLSHDRTVMTNYEYIGLRGIGKLISPRKRRLRMHQVDSFFKTTAPNPFRRTKVWLNLLPINIYTRKLAA